MGRRSSLFGLIKRIHFPIQTFTHHSRFYLGALSRTALFSTAEAGDVELTRFLLQEGANPNLGDYTSGSSPLIFILFAERYGKRRAYHQVALLLLAHDTDVKVVQGDGSTPLDGAAFAKDLPVLRTLLFEGANINAQNNEGWTALMWATYSNSDEGVKVLLSAGANPNLRVDDSYNGNDFEMTMATPLMWETQRGNAKMAALLLAHGADPNIVNRDGATTLVLLAQSHPSAFNADRAGIARMLLAHGANVNARTKNGNTALKWARAKGNAAMIQLLQNAGAKS